MLERALAGRQLRIEKKRWENVRERTEELKIANRELEASRIVRMTCATAAAVSGSPRHAL